MGTCFAPPGRVGVRVDTTPGLYRAGCIARGVACDGAMEMRLRCRAAESYPAAVRLAVNASRRWFHWQFVQTSTT